jgi:hypothetical protein
LNHFNFESIEKFGINGNWHCALGLGPFFLPPRADPCSPVSIPCGTAAACLTPPVSARLCASAGRPDPPPPQAAPTPSGSPPSLGPPPWSRGPDPHFSLCFGTRMPPSAPPLHALSVQEALGLIPCHCLHTPLPFVQLTARICHREQRIWSRHHHNRPSSVSIISDPFSAKWFCPSPLWSCRCLPPPPSRKRHRRHPNPPPHRCRATSVRFYAFLHVRRFPLALHQLEPTASSDLIVCAAGGHRAAPVALSAVTTRGSTPTRRLAWAGPTKSATEARCRVKT